MKKMIYKEEPHPSVAGSLNNLGLAYRDKGQYDQANQCYKESLEIRNQLYNMTIKDKDDKTVYANTHCPDPLYLLSNNVDVVKSIDLPVADLTVNPNISSTNTNDNINVDVALLGSSLAATNTDLLPPN